LFRIVCISHHSPRGHTESIGRIGPSCHYPVGGS
jgi:hypothetical protein